MTATKEIKDLMDQIEQRIHYSNEIIKSTNNKEIQLLTADRLKNLVDLYLEANKLYVESVTYETKDKTNKLLKECVVVLDIVTR